MAKKAKRKTGTPDHSTQIDVFKPDNLFPEYKFLPLAEVELPPLVDIPLPTLADPGPFTLPDPQPFQPLDDIQIPTSLPEPSLNFIAFPADSPDKLK